MVITVRNCVIHCNAILTIRYCTAMITDETWEALRPALEQGNSIAVTETAGNLGVHFDWVAGSYVSPIDGQTHAPEGGFKAYHPSTTAPPPSEGPINLDQVVILREPPPGQTSVENLTVHIKAVQAALLAEVQTHIPPEHFVSLLVDLDFESNGARQIKLAGNGLSPAELATFEAVVNALPAGPPPGPIRIEMHFKFKHSASTV